VLEELQNLARELLARDRRVMRVILFGSLARGEATVRSDADVLLVVKGEGKEIWEKAWRDWILHFSEASLPVDVIPVREERAENIPLFRRALKEGVILAERVPDL